MKSILTFEFDLPEEQGDLQRIIRANAMHSVLFHLDQELRNRIKYNEGKISIETSSELRSIRDKLHSLLDDEGVCLYDD